MRVSPRTAAVPLMLLAGVALSSCSDSPVAPGCTGERRVCARPERVVTRPGESFKIDIVAVPGYTFEYAGFYSSPNHDSTSIAPGDPVVVAPNSEITAVRAGTTTIQAYARVRREPGGEYDWDMIEIPVVVEGVWVPGLSDTLRVWVNPPSWSWWPTPDAPPPARAGGTPAVVADRPGVGQRVEWAIADPAIATVTDDGWVTARRIGQTRLSVRSVDDGRLPPAQSVVVAGWCADWRSSRGGSMYCAAAGTPP
jgi:hypothetical protein